MFVAGALAFAAVAVVVGINLNLAFAGAGSTTASTLGLTETSNLDNTSSTTVASQAFDADESSLLTKATSRNIDKAVNEMLAKEEAAKKAAEEAARAAEAAHQAEIAALQARSAGDAAAAGLEPVDWTMSHDDFVNYWAARIDAFLAGYPLAGQGRTFAEAAWTYGIDPRLSPAIANTETTRGLNCSVPYNAWGWGPHIAFSSWEEGINTQVKGLKDGGYGPMITYAGAQRYCPPSPDSWYRNTISSMAQI
ncbi:MAG: CMP-2-keto-3-deoxyoctulosonic acid synthetase [Eggerthellaceae bacterium]|nr:CMP-2-keto-3-deoxyoctulosonic acid synthetase [Eggerthellaceae bacterium]